MNSGGSRKTTSKAYANIGGTRKQIYPYNAYTNTYYTYEWYKYSVTYQTEIENWQPHGSWSINTTYYPNMYIYMYNFGYKGITSMPWPSSTYGYKIEFLNNDGTIVDGYTVSEMYNIVQVDSDGVLLDSGSMYTSSGDRSWAVALTSSQYNTISDGGYVYVNEIWRSTGGWEYKRGNTYIGQRSNTMNVVTYTCGYVKSSTYTIVTSENRNAYPDDGMSGSYWYVYNRMY